MPTLFTLDEALALLPTVRQLITEIQQSKQDYDAQDAELGRLRQLTGGNGHLAASVDSAQKALEATGARLQARVRELEDLGVQLKGIEQGLVDFPSERDGRVVLLCYLQGEETIGYWHDLETGFAGRQPL